MNRWVKNTEGKVVNTATRDHYEEVMAQRFARAGARLDDAVALATQSGADAMTWFREAIHIAREDATAVRAELQHLRLADPDRLVDHEAALLDAVRRLDADIAIAEGRLEANLAQSRERFIAGIHVQLSGWESRTEQLRVQLAETGQTHLPLEEVLADAERRRRLAQAKLYELHDETTDAWQGLRGGVQGAVDEVRDAVEKAASMLRDTPAR